MPAPKSRKLIAIVGGTATGKTALGIQLAQRFGGEVIGADSRQVYRYMDIGTAKPSAREQAAARHHLIDVVDPDEPFSLGAWLDLAHQTLEDVWCGGRQPIVVGGTGQYIWALLEGWRVPRVPPQLEMRQELSSRPPQELLAELRRVDPEAESYIDPRNVRRMIRALEVHSATGKPFSHWRTRKAPEFEVRIIGVSVPREELYRRIDARVEAIYEGGFVDEVSSLLDQGYSRELPSMSGIGYQEVGEYIAGQSSLPSAVERTKTGTHRLARHQNSWFKPADKRIHWVTAAEEIEDSVEQWLAAPSRYNGV